MKLSWMRLDTSFAGHRKVRRLAAELGIGVAQASGHLVLFWLNVLQNAPDGVLGETWDVVAIEGAAQWMGPPGELFRAMSSRPIRLLDARKGGGMEVHDWRRYAPDTREPPSSLAKVVKAAELVLSPSPPQLALVPTEPGNPRRRERVDHVVEAYRLHHPRARPGDKERELIASRLSEGYSIDDLREAIEGCHASPYHCGINSNGKRYQSLELIMRSSEKVAGFIAHAKDARAKSPDGVPVVLERQIASMPSHERNAALTEARWLYGGPSDDPFSEDETQT